MNRFTGTWRRDGGQVAGIILPCEAADLIEGSAITLSIRPEKILLQRPGQGLVDGCIASRFFLGSTWLFNVETPVGPVAVSVANQGSEPAAEGDTVSLGWTAGSLRVERSDATGVAP